MASRQLSIAKFLRAPAVDSGISSEVVNEHHSLHVVKREALEALELLEAL